MTKRQDIIFRTVTKDGKLLVTSNLEYAILAGQDGMLQGANRRSKRALPKLIKKLLK